jgi:hypothetical protein
MGELFVFDALFDLRNLRHLRMWVKRDAREDRFGVKEEVVERFMGVLKDGLKERGARPRIMVEGVDVSNG